MATNSNCTLKQATDRPTYSKEGWRPNSPSGRPGVLRRGREDSASREVKRNRWAAPALRRAGGEGRAQTLRDELKAKGVCLTHSDNLELVAKVLGFHHWYTLAAKIQSEDQSLIAQPGTTVPATAKPTLPTRAGLPTVPLRDIVLFPNTVVPLFAGRDATIRALGKAMAGDKRILAVTQRRAADDAPTPDVPSTTSVSSRA
jgi:hypothetical protein